MDANQQVSLVDQLRMDVRSLELDVHFVPSPWAGGAEAPVVCHGRGEDELHAGCTSERLFADRLAEIDGWLADHQREVILLYVEDHLGGDAGHAQGAAALEDVLGERIYRTGADGDACRQLPAALTRDDVLDAGKQVIVMGSCGTGAAWRAISFGDDDRRANESGGSDVFEGYPTCDPGRSQAYFDDHFIRYFEDSTGLSAGTAFAAGEAPPGGRDAREGGGDDALRRRPHRLRPAAARRRPPRRAGVELGRGRAAGERRRLRRRAQRRALPRRPAARSATRSRAPTTARWYVDTTRGQYRQGGDRCRRGAFAIPRRGVDAQRLRDAMGAAEVDAVWVRTAAAVKKAVRRAKRR